MGGVLAVNLSPNKIILLKRYQGKSRTSGVTRVGDTRGGNWGCHPSIFSWKTWRPFFSRQFCGVTLVSSSQKLTTFFAHRCHYHYRFLLLSLLSLGCHPLEGVTPHLFLPVRPRFSTILCPQKMFPSGVTPWRVSPGAVRPLRPSP